MRVLRFGLEFNPFNKLRLLISPPQLQPAVPCALYTQCTPNFPEYNT